MKEITDIIDMNQKKIEDMRPLKPGQISSLKEYYGIGLTWSSNAIEGNTLTESETEAVIKRGITVSGKPIEYSYEASGHYFAFEFMLELMRRKTIREDDIKTLHKLFYKKIDGKRAGKYRNSDIIITGSEYEPPHHDMLNYLMKEFIKTIKLLRMNYHPSVAAALIHLRFVEIHPFIDGNGRVARLLMNAVLVQNGYPIVIIPAILRRQYIAYLETAHNRMKDPEIFSGKTNMILSVDSFSYENSFIEFIQELIITAQEEYLRNVK